MIEREGPVHVSNVALVDPKDRKPTRVGTRRTEEGTRHARDQALGHRDRLDMARLKDAYNETDQGPR